MSPCVVVRLYLRSIALSSRLVWSRDDATPRSRQPRGRDHTDAPCLYPVRYTCMVTRPRTQPSDRMDAAMDPARRRPREIQLPRGTSAERRCRSWFSFSKKRIEIHPLRTAQASKAVPYRHRRPTRVCTRVPRSQLELRCAAGSSHPHTINLQSHAQVQKSPAESFGCRSASSQAPCSSPNVSVSWLPCAARRFRAAWLNRSRVPPPSS